MKYQLNYILILPVCTASNKIFISSKYFGFAATCLPQRLLKTQKSNTERGCCSTVEVFGTNKESNLTQCEPEVEYSVVLNPAAKAYESRYIKLSVSHMSYDLHIRIPIGL